MFGDQIYITALVELAGKTLVGKTWALDRSKIMADLAITDAGFEDIQFQIESRMSGRWNKASDLHGSVYIYKRLE